MEPGIFLYAGAGGPLLMIALLQRVSRAWVEVDANRIAQIDEGLLVLIGVQPHDQPDHSERLLERLLNYRVFNDAQGRMNRSLVDIDGGLLLVPQFTLAAETRKGLRPGFSRAAAPDHGRELFEVMVASARDRHSPVGCGRFGADMQVGLVNDGPVTFWLQN